MIDLLKDDGLWVVTLRRPEKANALTREMLNELADIAEAATAAKVLILTGKGKVFSAGADLDAVKAGLATDPVWERLSGAIAALPGLTIAALNGSVAGGALGMVLACDMRIAVPSAKVFYPVMRMGVLPQPSDPRRLAALVGPGRAKDLLLAASKWDAEHAFSVGFLDWIDADVIARAHALAEPALAASQMRVREIKALISR